MDSPFKGNPEVNLWGNRCLGRVLEDGDNIGGEAGRLRVADHATLKQRDKVDQGRQVGTP